MTFYVHLYTVNVTKVYFGSRKEQLFDDIGTIHYKGAKQRQACNSCNRL